MQDLYVASKIAHLHMQELWKQAERDRQVEQAKMGRPNFWQKLIPANSRLVHKEVTGKEQLKWS